MKEVEMVSDEETETYIEFGWRDEDERITCWI
jgi:hypothetical protein